MEEGLGPGSGLRTLTGGGARAGPAIFGGWGARRFLEWESLVPAHTSSSILCEKLRSGDVGERERENVSDERCSDSGVSDGCEMLSWLPWLFPEICPWVLSLGAVVVRHDLFVMSSVGRAQPG